jgi:hypothetical protein
MPDREIAVAHADGNDTHDDLVVAGIVQIEARYRLCEPGSTLRAAPVM